VSTVSSNQAQGPAFGCVAAANAMCRLTAAMGYDANIVVPNTAAKVPAVTAAIQEAMEDLVPDGMLCLSFAGHGVAYLDNEGAQRVAFRFYDRSWDRDQFLNLLTAGQKRLRIVVVALACHGVISEKSSASLKADLEGQGLTVARVLLQAEATAFWRSTAGWQTWEQFRVQVVGSPVSLIALASSKLNQLSQGTRPGDDLPDFTKALVEGTPQVQTYDQLTNYIHDHTPGNPATPVLNLKMLRSDDQGFALTPPFSIPVP
jgi:hypothetical protein